MTAITPLITLSQRRFELTARRPRELFVPLITPILFALVIAPALKVALHTGSAYESFVAVGTIGLLIPLTTMISGLSVIVDRESAPNASCSPPRCRGRSSCWETSPSRWR